MIRRDAGDHWLLISQVDHARLAADLAQAWGNESVAALPFPGLLVPAIRCHDDGWREWEQSPRVDPENGRPRDFLEMPMAEATAIWTRNIDAAFRREQQAADLLARFREFLAGRSKRLTADRSLIAVAALSMQGSFDADRLLERIAGTVIQRPLSRSTVYRTLGWLLGAGLLRRDPQVRDRHVYTTGDETIGPSALSALWVSRHFTELAAKALSSRAGHSDDRVSLDAFLATQERLCSQRLSDASTECGSTPPEEAVDAGLRWLQFFDRLSLWLCCAERTTTQPFSTLAGEFHITPLPSGEMAVSPYPFRGEVLQVSVEGRWIACGNYDDPALETAWERADRVQIEWTLVRW